MGIAVMAVPVFMHSPMQRKYAAKAEHAAGNAAGGKSVGNAGGLS